MDFKHSQQTVDEFKVKLLFFKSISLFNSRMPYKELGPIHSCALQKKMQYVHYIYIQSNDPQLKGSADSSGDNLQHKTKHFHITLVS